MRTSTYQTASVLALAASLFATAILWQWANVVYKSDQWKGWIIGASSLSVPVIVLSAFMIWLAHERRAGNADARVRWLPWLVGICVVLWIAMFLFSLM